MVEKEKRRKMSRNKEFQLGMLSEKWLQTKEIVIYGFGVIAKKCVDMLMEDFSIPYIIDNAEDKKGMFIKEFLLYRRRKRLRDLSVIQS